MTSIDRNSPIPLYYQLKNILLDKIRNGELQSGELLSSENQLQEEYELSRTTVRQTLAELVTEGYLIRERGRGTFIAEPKVTYDPARQMQLNEYMESQGINLRWQFIDQQWLKASEQVAIALQIREGNDVYCIRRLRLADNRPIGYHLAYCSKKISQYVDESYFSEGGSLDYLQNCPALSNSHVQRILEASIADKLDIDWLDAAPNTAILQMERIVYGKDNSPIEFLKARFRGDRFKFQITL